VVCNFLSNPTDLNYILFHNRVYGGLCIKIFQNFKLRKSNIWCASDTAIGQISSGHGTGHTGMVKVANVKLALFST
jgi:hypothetical protein